MQNDPLTVFVRIQIWIWKCNLGGSVVHCNRLKLD